jgi:hypothetical protein
LALEARKRGGEKMIVNCEQNEDGDVFSLFSKLKVSTSFFCSWFSEKLTKFRVSMQNSLLLLSFAT